MRAAQQVVLVTGAASGIGQELCRLFARRGAKIGLIDRNQSQLDAFSLELLHMGVPCTAVVADVSQRDRVHAAVREIAGALGPVDLVIPCAGICRASTVDDLKVSELEELVRINFLGTVYTIEAVLPSMLERKRGQIAGISSLAGVRGIPFEPAYSASKAAVAVYLESLRSELRPRGITVTTVFPGYVQTPLLDAINGSMGADMSSGKAVTPHVAAARIAKAIERGRSYTHFPVPLGLSVRLSQLLPPRLYDRVMSRMFARLPISHGAVPASNSDGYLAGGPQRTDEILGDHPVNAVLEHSLD